MQSEIISLINNIDVNLFLNAFAVFLLTNLIKIIVPKSFKKIICLLPFIVGTVLSFTYSYFILKVQDILFIVEKGVQSGGIATLIYAILKQVFKGNNLEKNISALLEGIMNSSVIKSVSQNILKNYSPSKSVEENSQIISNLIAQNTSVSQNECLAITSIILKTLTKK